MKSIIIAATLLMSISSIRLEMCDLCSHYHFEGKCLYDDCECNMQIEPKIIPFPDDTLESGVQKYLI